HELMRRLTSRTRRLLGINPKYGFLATIVMTSVHVKATRTPFSTFVRSRTLTYEIIAVE
ncbi:hypothetical protein PIB30_099667, partial [Stylosanthes scabra]|nr:hypothetical protein [Stylosanthes scabra]